MFLLSCFLPFVTFAQELEVSGMVVSIQDGLPLPGVTILIKGENSGTTSDFDGNYSIRVSSTDAELIFSYIGYADQNITVNGRQNINVSLKQATTDLDEVIVVGYGTARRGDVTGAVASVKGSSIEKGRPLSVQSALAGRVAGVQISQTDNSPGAGMRILIRGGSTLTGGNQPLYVIDNFPIIPDDSDPSQNPLADLNPNDIESIEVLKDASATAVYGALGANGVILITTKLGKTGKPQINFQYNSGVSVMTNTPNILNDQEYLNWQIERGPQLNFLNSGNQTKEQQWIDIKNSGQRGSVWIDRITRPALTNQADISFSGGSDGMKYRLSAGYLGQEGVIKNSDLNRTNLSANIQQKIGKNIKIGSNITYSLKKTKGLVTVWDQNSLLKTVFQLNPFMPDDFEISEFPVDDPTFIFNSENVLTFIDEVQNFSETERTLGNLFFEYKLTDNLRWWTSYGINRFRNSDSQFYPTTVRRGQDPNGFAKFRTRNTENTNFQTRLNYNKSVNKHSFNATAVFEARTQNVNLQTFGASNFEEQSLGLFDLSSASQADFPVNLSEETTAASYLARLGYSYANKYLLTASFRGDADSRFGSNNKWGYFPSIALGWIASEEKFMKDSNTFDLFKLRISYGETGNSQIPTYQSLARLNTQRYIFDDALAVGQVPGSIANPDLQWEITTQYNVGLDLAFLNNRISVTADAYYKETNDLLLDVQLPLTSGFQTAVKNVGSISSKGFELALNTVNIETEDFRWNTAFTFSTNKTKVLDLGEREEMYFSRVFNYNFRDEILLRVGEEVGTFVGYIEDQVLNSQTEIANSPDSQLLENIPGQVKFKDVNGDGVIDSNDRVIIGNTQPDFIGGFNSEINYKNFDFSFFLRWSYGNDVINANTLFLDRVGNGNWNTLAGFADNAFSPLNPNGTVHGQVPDTYSNFMKSNLIEDGSYLKCDYITLGYTLPSNIWPKSYIKSMRLFARVNNPFMITRYGWFDPEVSSGFGTVAKVGPGVDFASYPRSVTFTIGASINL
ncbi:TonB-linked outer membrane protein, SusC/RagA family [Lutibacter agarilyticus]|uniref:TonB-linked outer membrane protein, SusC/RagA family n=2 Tax=Lutibacter agarilyticus TaxID=1109740 RepID=A0A238X6G0_9FLAO|nr:TonB-linked outer membrane protein, SusC/RagA family [Lutibacter agarilyticus]